MGRVERLLTPKSLGLQATKQEYYISRNICAMRN